MTPVYHLLIVLFLIIPAISHGGIDIFEKNAAGTWVKSALPNKFALTFLPLSGKPGNKLIYQGAITLPKEIEAVEPLNETTQVSVNKNSVSIQVLSFEDVLKIKFKDKTEQEFRLVMDEKKFRLYNDKCKTHLINFKVSPVEKSAKIPAFPLGLSCAKYEDKIALVMSMPSEAESGESSMVEGGGKGESWKFYELPSTSRDDGVIGHVKFKVKAVEINVTLQNARLKEKENEPPKKNVEEAGIGYFKDMHFGLGTKSLSFVAGTVSASASGYALGFGALTKPVWRKLYLGADFNTALVSSSSANAISFTELSGLLGYSFEFGKSTLMPFGFGKSVDFLHKQTQTRLQAILAGLGADYSYAFGKNQISVRAEFGVFTAKGVSSQMLYQIGYLYLINEKSKLGLGLYYRNQEFKAVNSANEQRAFKDGDIMLKASMSSF